MSDEETITVELTRREAEALQNSRSCEGTHGETHTHVAAQHKIINAIAKHDAKQNPLGLPWEATLHAGRWWVRHFETDGKSAIMGGSEGLSEGQARLRAAAPEMAGALEMLLKPRAETLDGRLAGDHARRVARAALRKAGR